MSQHIHIIVFNTEEEAEKALTIVKKLKNASNPRATKDDPSKVRKANGKWCIPRPVDMTMLAGVRSWRPEILVRSDQAVNVDLGGVRAGQLDQVAGNAVDGTVVDGSDVIV